MLLEPAWRGVDDPIEKIFALLAQYRRSLTMTECQYGCPIGSLALELHEPDPPVRDMLAKNFEAWVLAIKGCLDAARDRLPPTLNRRELAEFILTTMEGAVMQARTYRDIRRYDNSVRQLRAYVDTLMQRPTKRTAGRPKTQDMTHSTRTFAMRTLSDPDEFVRGHRRFGCRIAFAVRAAGFSRRPLLERQIAG